MHPPARAPIVYPDRDGLPMSDNTLQFSWIQLLVGNLEALYRERSDVFVAGDLLWYPVEGRPDVRAAPDALVALGRPKGYRGSYKQWEEGGVALQVVFEVLSPGNTQEEMAAKFDFYDRFGVEEYYIVDPDRNALAAYVRGQVTLRRIRPVDGHISPRLGIRFRVADGEVAVFRPDGRRFVPFEELDAAVDQANQRAAQADQRAAQLAQAAAQADQRAAQLAQAAAQADQRAAQLAQAAAQADQRAAQLARVNGRLVELSRKLRQGQATPQEVAELERLELEIASPDV